MVNRCCVPKCKGNLAGGEKVSVFKLPKSEERRKSWLRFLRLDDDSTSSSSRVCELHFTSDDFEDLVSVTDRTTGKIISYKREVPKLKDSAVPSKLPNCPAYYSTERKSRPSREERRAEAENRHFQHQMTASTESYAQNSRTDSISCKLDITEKLTLPKDWVYSSGSDFMICKIRQNSNSAPHIPAALSISSDLKITAFLDSTSLQNLGNFEFPYQCNSLSNLETLLDELDLVSGTAPGRERHRESLVLLLIYSLLTSIQKSSKFSNTLALIAQQIHLMTLNKVTYFPDFLVFSSLLYSISPCAFRFLRQSAHLLLPSIVTIRKITLSSSLSPSLEQRDELFLNYIRQKYAALKKSDLTVMLLIDEIHLQQFFDYKGGNIVGSSFNSPKAASTAFVFMIKSLFSSLKDVVHIIPSSSMSAEILQKFIDKIIKGLEKIGFTVVCVITDNNAINRKAMSLFASPPALSIVYRHPYDKSRPLFFLFDTVHVLKCIRNNWLKNKIFKIPPFNFGEISLSGSSLIASFQSIRAIFSVDDNSLLKFAYNLSLKALSPSNLERQNVTYVLQVFNEYVSEALMQLGPKHNISDFSSTSSFIQIVTTWWSIVNVKSPYLGSRVNNVFQQPIVNSENVSLKFLKYMLDWLDSWKSLDTNIGKLTKETFSALSHSTYALIELSSYCINELGAKYVLLGKFQTDSLEARFGQYRQLSGGKYDVSIRQVFECEKKIRLLSLLKLSISNKSFTLNNFFIDWSNFDFSSIDVGDIHVDPPNEDDRANIESHLPVITYVAGYCSHIVNKKMACDSCRELVVCSSGVVNSFENSFISGISRGKLLYPSLFVVNILTLTYFATDKLCSNAIFKKSMCQRKIATEIIFSLVVSEEVMSSHRNSCNNNHEIVKVAKIIIWSGVNIMLNNYCKDRNNNVTECKNLKKRKLSTFN